MRKLVSKNKVEKKLTFGTRTHACGHSCGNVDYYCLTEFSGPVWPTLSEEADRAEECVQQANSQISSYIFLS